MHPDLFSVFGVDQNGAEYVWPVGSDDSSESKEDAEREASRVNGSGGNVKVYREVWDSHRKYYQIKDGE